MPQEHDHPIVALPFEHAVNMATSLHPLFICRENWFWTKASAKSIHANIM